MASETKASTTRRKTSTETPAKPSPKTSTATSAKVAKTTKATPKAEAAKKKTAAAETTAKPAEKKPRKTKPAAMPIAAEVRLRHIELAAYYIAEQRGFSGSPAENWFAAEQQIDNLLLAGKLPA